MVLLAEKHSPIAFTDLFISSSLFFVYRVILKFTIWEYGARSVMMNGIHMMQLWCANNLDFLELKDIPIHRSSDMVYVRFGWTMFTVLAMKRQFQTAGKYIY